MQHKTPPTAEVLSVLPSKVTIAINDLDAFNSGGEKVRVGSYIKIVDNDNAVLIAIVESFSMRDTDTTGAAEKKYMIEAIPLGMIRNGTFERGGDSLAIPPKEVTPGSFQDINVVYAESVPEGERFCFSSLSADPDIRVPVNGNNFFNKHIAVIGSTGSGKSHTVAKIIQSAVEMRSGGYSGLNNSHVIIFDIHSEYRTAFPNANYLDITNLRLPYWMLNSEELQELFIDSSGSNDYNQRNAFKEGVVFSKKSYYDGPAEKRELVGYDTATVFDIRDVLNHLIELNEEMVEGARAPKAGPMNGKLSNFISRLENKINDPRMQFLLGEEVLSLTFADTLRQFIGYGSNKSNVTIVDLSGVPFEVLSITVSFITRMLFEYGYYYKRLRCAKDPEERINNNTPFLLVYEEAHKYVPDSGQSKFSASKKSIERIAKEGRKYGITLMLASQRPSEISATIFSQCSNFITMRLTNPSDQDFVKRLLPDAMGQLTDRMPSLRSGEALLIGESVVLPSAVKIDRCEDKPSSNDIPYLELWRDQWQEPDLDEIIMGWRQ